MAKAKKENKLVIAKEPKDKDYADYGDYLKAKAELNKKEK